MRVRVRVREDTAVAVEQQRARRVRPAQQGLRRRDQALARLVVRDVDQLHPPSARLLDGRGQHLVRARGWLRDGLGIRSGLRWGWVRGWGRDRGMGSGVRGRMSPRRRWRAPRPVRAAHHAAAAPRAPRRRRARACAARLLSTHSHRGCRLGTHARAHMHMHVHTHHMQMQMLKHVREHM